MADGTVLRTGGKNVKDVAGYSLTHLIVGRGDPGDGDGGDPAAAPAASATLHAHRVLLLAGGGRRRGRRSRPAGLSPVTLELIDRFTIGAVNDMQGLGLAPRRRRNAHRRSRPARGAAGIEMDAARSMQSGRCNQGDPGDRPAGGGLVSSGPARSVPRARAAGIGTDGGVGVPQTRFPQMLVGSRPWPRSTRCGSGRSVARGTATSAPRSSFSATTRTRRPSTKRRGATCSQPRSRSAARSPASTALASRGTTTSSSSAAPAPSRVMRKIKVALDPQGILNPGRVLA